MMTKEKLMMKKYRVNWTDNCSRDVEANSEEEAIEIANELGSDSTEYFQDCDIEEL